MAWGATANRQYGGHSTASTTLTWETLNATTIGRPVFVMIAFDNTSTADGETNEVTSVVDGDGRAYTKIKEYCNGNGAAGAGCTVSVWYRLQDASWSGNSGVITFANSVVAKAYCSWELTIGAGNVVTLANSATEATDAADWGSLSPTVASGEYLWLRVTATEDNWFTSVSPSVTSNFTELVGTGSSTGGARDTNIALWVEYRIFTGTSNASNPASGVSSDTASVYLVLKEAAGGGGSAIAAISGNFLRMQMNN